MNATMKMLMAIGFAMTLGLLGCDGAGVHSAPSGDDGDEGPGAPPVP